MSPPRENQRLIVEDIAGDAVSRPVECECDRTLAVAPTYTNEEILAAWEMKAAYWENEARNSPPEVAVHCLDYAKHIRTLAECLRMDMMEQN